MKKPKIMMLDIEASNLSANFGYILCVAYKYLGEKPVYCIGIDDFPASFKGDCTNDKKILEKIEGPVNESDMVMGWYSSRFDWPFLQTRRLMHGLKPLANIPHVDLWKVAKYQLRFNSNRLDTVSKAIPLDQGCQRQLKTPLDSQYWIRGSAGHRPSIKYIKEHCRKDVLVLEAVFNKLKPFISSMPSMALLTMESAKGCDVCGNPLWKCKKWGTRATNKTLQQRYNCHQCGHWFTMPLRK